MSSIKVALLWIKKQADLNPPLGYPGGPCYLIERILAKKLGPKQEMLIRLVEQGEDLDDKENLSHMIYDKHLERKVPGTQFEWLGLTSHVQYRMDLRGITVRDIRVALMDFQQEFSREKSRKSPWWAKIQRMMDNSEELTWVSKRLDNLAIGFIVMSENRVSPGAYVKTVFFEGVPKPGPVKREDCKSWDKWVESTPKPTQLEKLFEGKTGSLYLKRAGDLYPPLGYPGGPCQVMERIRDGVPNPRLQEDLVDSVEQGLDLSNPQAAKIYNQMVAPGVPGTPTSKIVFTNHAQYRMDLRGITIPQVRNSLRNFWKALAREKSMKTPLYKEWEEAMAWGGGIRWEDPKSEFSLVFESRKDTVFVVTLFWTKFTKPPVVDESRCKYDQPLPAEGYFEDFPLSGTKTKLGLKSGPEPVTTYVSDKSEKNLPTDQDRENQVVLPLPGSATPGGAGRDVPKFEYNTPGPGSNISERPRTLGVPGEQYGVPYKEDYNMPTRRTMTASRPELFWGEELEELEGDPWDLAYSVGVRILRNKEFRAGYQVDGEVIAALFDDPNDSKEYSFDIVVSPKFQKSGLGKELLEIALGLYSENKEVYGEDYKMKLDVVNPVMERILRSKGFVEVGRVRGITLMEKQASRIVSRFLSQRGKL